MTFSTLELFLLLVYYKIKISQGITDFVFLKIVTERTTDFTNPCCKVFVSFKMFFKISSEKCCTATQAAAKPLDILVNIFYVDLQHRLPACLVSTLVTLKLIFLWFLLARQFGWGLCHLTKIVTSQVLDSLVTLGAA